MYPKHKAILVLLSAFIGFLCYLFQLRIIPIASDVISVVSISSALYLAAYAGIQASVNLKENLKKVDSVFPHRTQRYVLNSYIKTALVLNIMTIISTCASIMVADKIAQYSLNSSYRFIDFLEKLLFCNAAAQQNVLGVWPIIDKILNITSASLFVANLIQMSFIGKFIVNRLPFDK